MSKSSRIKEEAIEIWGDWEEKGDLKNEDAQIIKHYVDNNQAKNKALISLSGIKYNLQKMNTILEKNLQAQLVDFFLDVGKYLSYINALIDNLWLYLSREACQKEKITNILDNDLWLSVGQSLQRIEKCFESLPDKYLADYSRVISHIQVNIRAVSESWRTVNNCTDLKAGRIDNKSMKAAISSYYKTINNIRDAKIDDENNN